MAKESVMPSGAVLKIQPAPFAEAKALWQAILKELKTINVSFGDNAALMLKDIFCAGFSSPYVELCLKPCLQRCTLDGLKIDDDTFEPELRRQDYVKVCAEVVRENVLPFVKALFAEFKTASAILDNIQK